MPGMVREYTARIPGGILRRVHSLVLDRFYDSRLGVNTDGLYRPSALSLRGGNAPFASEYIPTPVRVFRRALAALGIGFNDLVFVDFGSGKGRTLLLAAALPFRRIEGVEFAPELHQVALKNLSRLPLNSRCTDIRLHLGDAACYPIPQEACVFYLYHPFGAPVLARVLDNIAASYRARPRPMYFVYLNPKHHALFDGLPFVEPIRLPWTARVMNRLISPEPIRFYRTK